jgi:hypothetical protein
MKSSTLPSLVASFAISASLLAESIPLANASFESPTVVVTGPARTRLVMSGRSQTSFHQTGDLLSYMIYRAFVC